MVFSIFRLYSLHLLFVIILKKFGVCFRMISYIYILLLYSSYNIYKFYYLPIYQLFIQTYKLIYSLLLIYTSLFINITFDEGVLGSYPGLLVDSCAASFSARIHRGHTRFGRNVFQLDRHSFSHLLHRRWLCMLLILLPQKLNRLLVIKFIISENSICDPIITIHNIIML